MAEIGHNSGDDPVQGDHLQAIAERIESLEEEKKTNADDIKDVYAESKGTGYDTKVLRKVLAIRKRDRNEVQEEQAVMELYCTALGMDWMN